MVRQWAFGFAGNVYNYSFERLGLDYVYVAFDIKVEEVADAIAAMRTFKMRGCNVTMPCKTEVVKYMDELSRRHRSSERSTRS